MDDVMGYGPEVYVGTLERRGTRRTPVAGRVNVGKAGRVARMAGGVALILLGATRRSRAVKAATIAAGAYVANTGRTGHSPLYEALGVSSAGLAEGAGLTIERSVTVQRLPEEAYAFWRPENLPLFMAHLDAVWDTGGGVTHWDFRGPAGSVLEWDAETIEDRPGELVSWQTLPGSSVEHAGSVHFAPAPGGRGTEVRLKVRYRPANGAAAFLAAKAMGKLSEEQVEMELRRFKQLMEAGELPTIEGQPSGHR